MKRFFVLMALMLLAGIGPAPALEIKQSSTYVDKVLMLNATNSTQVITGLTNATVSVYFCNATGGATAMSPVFFTEVNSTSMPGLYNLTLDVNVTGSVGPLVYYVTNANSLTFRGKHEVVVNLENDTYARIGSPAGASVSADIAAVKSDSGAIKTQTDKMAFTVANKIDSNVYTWNGTAIGGTATAGIPDVNVKNIANAAVSTSTAQIGVNAVQIGGAVPGSATIGTVTTLTTWDKTNYALSAAGIDAIWDEVQTGHTTASSFGKYLDKQLTTFNDITAASIWIAPGRTLTAGTNITLAKGTGITGFNDIAATDVWAAGTRALTDKTDFALTTADKVLIANQTWDTSRTGHTGAGTFGLYLDAQVSTVGGGTLTAGDIWNYTISGYTTGGMAGTYLKGAGSAGDPWTTVLPGSYGAGTAGYIIGNNINATISSRSSHSAADVAALILATPANKLATNATGYVSVDKTGYTVSTVQDKTGYSLTQTFPGNFSSMLITSAGKITVGTNDDKTGYTASTVSDKTGYSLASGEYTNIWNKDISAYSGAGYAGTYLKGLWDKKPAGNFLSDTVWNSTMAGYLNATISSRSSHSAADVAALILATPANKLATNATGYVSVDKTGYTLSAAGVGAIWDEVQTDHTIANTFGKYLDAQVSTVGGGSLTAGDIWNYTISGYVTSGLAGTYLKNAGAAGDPWDVNVTTGYTGKAGEFLRNINYATDGQKENGNYTGIEEMIRIHR
jgi:hypothetical protein